MRKPRFYAKLAWNNLWRNRASYLPYLLACVTSIFTLYCLWAIFYGGTLSSLPYTSYVHSFTLIGSIITAIFCSVLLFWTNAYLIKRRKKELALYSILGMEKRNIAIVMLFETLYIAAIALILGILAGMLLSRLLFAGMLRLIQQPVDVAMQFSFKAVVNTVVFFGVVFLLVLVRNLRQVRLATPTSMLEGAKAGEREPRASWLLVLLGLVGVGGGYYIAFTVKNPGQALYMFLLAVLLVIIGTYCLFTAGSIAVLKLLRRNRGYYYQPRHFISVSGMIYRMKQNAAGLASICILSCMVLVTVASTVTLYAGVDDSLQNEFPYEYNVRYYQDELQEEIEASIGEMAAEAGVTLVDYANYATVNHVATVAGNRVLPYQNTGPSVDVRFMTVEDYNAIHGQNATLDNGEALVYYTESFDVAPLEDAGWELDVYGVGLAVGTVPELNRAELGKPAMQEELYIILPDTEAMIEVVSKYHMINGVADDPEFLREISVPLGGIIHFDVAGGEAQRAAFGDLFAQRLDRNDFEPGTVWSAARENQVEGWYAAMGGFLFLGIYFGIMFLLATVLIIYYKQISEGHEDAERFDILQKVGMSEREVRKTINSQIRTVFYLPLLVAVLHITVAMLLVRRVLIVFGVLNWWLIIAATLATILLYAFVYLLVYQQTARTYFRIVRRQA